MIEYIIFALPFSVIFALIFIKLSHQLYKEDNARDRLRNSLYFTFFAGLVGIAFAQTIFKNNPKLKNDLISSGLTLGGLYLIYHTVIANWSKLENDSKILILGIMFGVIVWAIYFKSDDLFPAVDFNSDTDDADNSTDETDEDNDEFETDLDFVDDDYDDLDDF